MSSSDSDDDCYGNVAQKLQSLKNKYVQEKTLDISNNSNIEPGECSTKQNLSETCTVLDDNVSLNRTGSEELSLDAIIANNTKPKRGRKRKNDNVSSSPRRTRSKRKNTKNNENETLNVEPAPVTPAIEPQASILGSPRGRGRRGQRNTRTRPTPRRRGATSRGGWFPSPYNHSYPVYSVGNTDEYPDLCDNQQLFSTKPNDVQVIEDDDPLEADNEELSVKVHWQSIEVIRFNIRRHQTLSSIFKYFSEKENVGNEKLLFMYDNKLLRAESTPDSINYSIAKFIEGGIVNQDISGLVRQNNDDVDGIKLKFQCQNIKKPYETTIRATDKLSLAMMKCAEHLETTLERLKFYFDGDLVSGKSTPAELELEGGECFDVKLINS